MTLPSAAGWLRQGLHLWWKGVRSIRYYEQQGLRRASRRASGYREFEDAVVELVSRIRILLRNGFTIEEIRSVAVELDDAKLGSVCEDVIALYHAKLGELDARILELQQLQERIRSRLAVIERQREERHRP